jgi:hypothetical protein
VLRYKKRLTHEQLLAILKRNGLALTKPNVIALLEVLEEEFDAMLDTFGDKDELLDQAIEDGHFRLKRD